MFLFTNVWAQAPSCTSLSNPVDGATDVPVTTIIQWNAVATATNYIVTIGTTSGGTDVLDNWPVGTDLNYTPPSGLLPNTTYFVTITPNNNSGNAVNCSEESFTTGEASSIPGCVTLLTPFDGAYGVPPGVDLSWAPQTVAEGYFLSVGTTSGSVDILDNLDVGNVTSYDLPADLPPFQRIYVTITPYNTAGETANCAEVDFRTRGNSPPMCTEIIDPIDGGLFVSVTANITWIRDFNASGYRMTIWEKAIGGIKILDNVDVGTGTNFKPPNFKGNTLYFVRITPYNDLGEAPNCQPISFTTGDPLIPPECTSLRTPANNDRNVNVSTDLVWTAVPEADGYNLSVGSFPGGTDILDTETVFGVNSFDLADDLPEDTRIYVRIVPFNNNGEAEECREESFTTEQAANMLENVPVPQFFTPNNDGFNDQWIVNSPSEIAVTNVWIFNRFGQLLRRMDAGVGWDGNFNGKPMASDSYWYRIDMADGNSVAGFFLLKR
ncbi:MAG: T9SS type B sorting domain-containing protein [Flavobacteriaceae bacterium]